LNPDKKSTPTQTQKTPPQTTKSKQPVAPTLEPATSKPSVVEPTIPTVTATTPVFNACENRDCSKMKDRPLLENGAVIHVVFGIKGIDRSKVPVGHVLDMSLVSMKNQEI